MKTIKQRRPEMSLAQAIEQETAKSGPRKGVAKQAVSMKAVEGGGLLTLDSMRPSDEQVEKVNQFTRSPKTADELLVFPMLSCNDMYDRDDEGFKGLNGTSAIQQMHALEPPYSFVGKSFMMDHDYTVSKQIGRLFDEEVVTQDGIEFLKHWVYMPNTEQFAPIAEKIDFGVQWAVSVGLVMESTACSICSSPMYKSAWMGIAFCMENGHEKGMYYDPSSDETDEYGWAAPVSPEDSKAVKCFLNMYDPRDGYEVSSVFLGAQYYAELSKDPNFKGVVKAAAAGGVPILGLSSKEADSLPIPHEPEVVREARLKYAVEADEDGDPTWTDDQGLKWVFDSTSNEVLSLGKDAEDGEEGSGDGEPSDGSELRADGDEVPVGDDAAAEDGVVGDSDGVTGRGAAGGEGVESGDDPESGLTEDEDEESSEEEDAESEDESGEEDTKAVNTNKLFAIAAEAGIPEEMLARPAVKQARSVEGVVKALLSEAAATMKSMQKRAEIGDEFIVNLQADAIDWYTKAHIDPSKKGVDTTVFEKMLNKVGDDVELLRDMIEEQKSLARAKFPQSVRRSSFESNHNQPTGPGELDIDDIREKSLDRSDETVRQIHR